METEIKEQGKQLTFGDVPRFEYFVWSNELFVKVPPTETPTLSGANAVRPNMRKFCYFSDTTQVRRVTKPEVTIE